jgi:hypothetical protein
MTRLTNHLAETIVFGLLILMVGVRGFAGLKVWSWWVWVAPFVLAFLLIAGWRLWNRLEL